MCNSRLSQCFNISLTSTPFICAKRGRFSHPDSAWMFYKCGSSHSSTCVCTCAPGKIFDPSTSICRRVHESQVDSMNNDEIRTRLHTKLNKVVDTQRLLNSYKSNNKSATRTKFNPYLNDVNYFDERDAQATTQMTPSLPHNSANDTFSSPGTLKTVNVTRSRQMAHHTFQSMEDYSWFPAWAIALLVLIGVIVMMLVVLIMY